MNSAGTPNSDAPESEKNNSPRRLLERRGARCLSDSELLAVILDAAGTPKKSAQKKGISGTKNAAGTKISETKIGVPEESADEISRRILEKVAGSIYRLSRWNVSDFRDENLSFERATSLAAALELARRFEDRMEIAAKISSARDVFEFFEKKVLPLEKEKCWIICLDARNQVMRYDEVSSGTATGTIFHPRDFLRPAVRCNANAIILVHNHPSGDSAPSRNDIDITSRLGNAAKILGIKFLDHVIVGRKNVGAHTKGFFSFSEATPELLAGT